MENKTEGRRMRDGVMLSTQGYRLSHLQGPRLSDGAARCLRGHLVLHCGQTLGSAGATSPLSNQRQSSSLPPIRAEHEGGTKSPGLVEARCGLGSGLRAGGRSLCYRSSPARRGPGAGLETRFRVSSSSTWLMLTDRWRPRRHFPQLCRSARTAGTAVEPELASLG